MHQDNSNINEFDNKKTFSELVDNYKTEFSAELQSGTEVNNYLMSHITYSNKTLAHVKNCIGDKIQCTIKFKRVLTLTNVHL